MTDITKKYLDALKEKGFWNNEYDYSKVIYTSLKNSVLIIDETGFEHSMNSYSLLMGNQLSIQSVIDKNNYWIKKAKETHGDEYDYSLVEYKGNKTKVKITCPIHGLFETVPQNHINGSKCMKCNGKLKSNTEDFIISAKKIHGDKYNYSLVDYKSSTTKVTIICPKHNEFLQTPIQHLKNKGCTKCSGKAKLSTNDFIERAKSVHGDKYDYSLVDYKNANTKVKIICPTHGTFEIVATHHINEPKQGCASCSAINKVKTNDDFFKKAKLIHGNKYDYSLVDYTGGNNKVKIICPTHGTFEQKPKYHISKRGRGCGLCGNSVKKTTDEFIENAKLIHGDKYDYSLVNYKNNKTKVSIICPTHKTFNIIPKEHLNGQKCPLCVSIFTKQVKLHHLNNLSESDLLFMDAYELYIIIKQGKLPNDFNVLQNSVAGSKERIKSLKDLITKYESSTSDNEEVDSSDNDIEIKQTSFNQEDFKKLIDLDKSTNEANIDIIKDLNGLDNTLYAEMDEEAFESLIKYKLRKLWNNLLNGKIEIDQLRNETGGKYFETIKDLFLTEFDKVHSYKAPEGYTFEYEPSLMQKLTVHRLLQNKNYGNWSGTGAGKTNSFIIASREIDSKLTLVIVNNSTIEQIEKTIKNVYRDSVVYTSYDETVNFDLTKHNYLIVNYEKFQQPNATQKFLYLTNRFKIDFIVLDEIHNTKKREEKYESKRREVLSRLIVNVRENNPDLYVLAMSATPVINNLYEAVSLLELLTGMKYDDLNIRPTISNAMRVFQQLLLNGLRFIPNYPMSIKETEVTINGDHLLEELSKSDSYIKTEKILLNDKLNSIVPFLRKGTIICSYWTDGFIKSIKKFVESKGFKVGTYTGDDDAHFRTENLTKFINGEIDILIGSKPIGTGVDGLQKVCNQLILITLPWTDSEYVQLKGRIYRQGSEFSNVEVIIPQVEINLNGTIWSSDTQRMNIIKNKRTLGDIAVDGIIPKDIKSFSLESWHKKSIEALNNWKERLNNNDIINMEREKISSDDFSVLSEDEIKVRNLSEISRFNSLGKRSYSYNMNKYLNDNQEEWFNYHRLREESCSNWNEIPYEYISTKIKNQKDIVIDFGCGTNKFKDLIVNRVHSFDHIAIDSSVIACDMRDISEHISNESVDVCVFSLSLWGANYSDYLNEAYRVLNYRGVVYVAEPSDNYTTQTDIDTLIDMCTSIGFSKCDVENRGKFTYFTLVKL